MYFPARGSAAVALMAALASASPIDLVERNPLLGLDANANANGKGVSASVSLDVSLQEELLVAGVIADVAVAPVLGAVAAAEVAILCKNCYVHGNVDASISLEKVVPALSLSLTDIEAYLDLDIQIGAATTIAVNLFTPEDLIKLSLPGLQVEAKVFLDLVLDVEAAIDLSAGVYVELVDEARLETDLLAGKILDAAFSGLSVTTLPVTVRIGCTRLQADLRLRVQAAVGLDLEVDDILPILDVVPDIGAGVEVAVFANLLEYVGLFCDTPSCPLSAESYGLNIGAAVGLNVEVEDVATLRLAPTISTAMLTVPTSSICDHGPRPSATASLTVSLPNGPIPTGTDGGDASLTVSLPSGPIPTGTNGGDASLTVSLPNGPVPTGTNGGDASLTVSLPSGPIPTGTNGGDISFTRGYPIGVPSGLPSGVPSISAPVSLTTSAATLPTAGEGEITSTVTVPKTYTITTCAAHVANCPPEYQGEKTVIHTIIYTTVCPATATITDLPKPSGSTSTTVSKPKPTVTLTPTSCVETFTPPTNVPTPPASSYPGSSASTTAPSTGVYSSTAVPSGSASSSYPGSSVSTTGGVPSSASTLYPTGGKSITFTGSESSAVTPTPSTGYPGSSLPPYPTTGVSTTGNSTTSYETQTPGVPQQPSASTFYPTTLVVPPTGGYPTTTPLVPTGGYPTAPPPAVVTGAAIRNAAQSVAGAVVVGALFAMM